MDELKRYSPVAAGICEETDHGCYALLAEATDAINQARREERERIELELRALTRWSDGTEVDEVDAAVLALAADEVAMSEQPVPVGERDE